MPNARRVILTPGADWRRLYSARSTRRATARTVSRSKPAADDLLDGVVLLDVGLQDRVEDVVGRQGVGVLLARPQLRRRRLGERRLRDHRAQDRRVHRVGQAGRGVAPAGELVDQRLGDVLDHGEAAGHVAVERRVADRVLALVAGGQDDVAVLVRQRHEQVAADARLDVLLGHAGGGALERVGERAVVGGHHVGDGDHLVADAEVLRELLGVRQRVVRGVRRRHRDALHG